MPDDPLAPTEQATREAASAARAVVRFRQGEGLSRDGDRVVVEEPLLVQIDGESYAVIMRTPGHDAELASGFLHGEGVLREPGDLLALEMAADASEPDRSNVVNVRLTAAARSRVPEERRRAAASSACGVCGRRSIEEIRREAPPLPSQLKVTPELLLPLPARMRQAQRLFAETGGLHAAALFDARGRLLVVREDVGRHCAVDKAVGHAYLHGSLPLSDAILMVSGRAGYEIVEKAVRAGIPIVCAVSAPSSLAIDLGHAAGVAVVGFLREGGFNVYTAAHRVTG